MRELVAPVHVDVDGGGRVLDGGEGDGLRDLVLHVLGDGLDPLVVEDGEMEFDLTATREQFETIGTALDASGYEYELLSVVEGRNPETLLTDRQRECLTVAFREGYFQVPRECTLEDVADAIGVDKSTASETLRRGSARVLEWFLVGSTSTSPTESGR